jgi:hypothetical protein
MGGEMAQTMYAYMNKWINKKKERKQHGNEQMVLDQSHPQPTFNTNPNIRNCNRHQLVCLYLTGTGVRWGALSMQANVCLLSDPKSNSENDTTTWHYTVLSECWEHFNCKSTGD